MTEHLQVALSPYTVVTTASAFVGVEDTYPRRGPWVRLMLSEVGEPADKPWGPAFVSHVGYRAHQFGAEGPSSWPVPRTGSIADLHAFARERRIIRERPEEGDIALVWSRARGTYTRAGIVAAIAECSGGVSVRDWLCRVTLIEGNVTPHGAPHGPGVYRVPRMVTNRSRMLFMRWVDLDRRGAFGMPTVAAAIEMGRVVLRRCA